MSQMSVLEETRDLLVQGGWVMLPIFLLGLVAWTLLFDRYLAYNRAKHSKTRGILLQLQETVSKYLPLGRGAIDNGLEEVRHSIDVDLSKAFSMIAVCATLAPMLGLLGTVSGMIHVFETIQSFGFGNPVLIADGISEALLTTQAGLLVAFPIVLANNWLLSKIEQLKAKCWEKTLHFENRQLAGEGA